LLDFAGGGVLAAVFGAFFTCGVVLDVVPCAFFTICPRFGSPEATGFPSAM
jgi:hypothetical protein